MRLLIDSPLSPSVAHELTQAGHDAVHVRDRGLAAASDGEILALAEREDRIIVSADTDFGTLLALGNLKRPSFILLRGEIERRPEAQAQVLIREIPSLEEHLNAGAIVVITRDRIRLRLLSTAAG